MKHTFIALLCLSVCGCGVEAVGSAATAASVKKQEIQEGQKTMQRMQGQIEQLNLQAVDRTRDADEE